MVSALDSGSRGPGSSPGRVIVLCSWESPFTLTVLLSTQEYKWTPANCQGNLTKCWGVTCDGLASHPGGVPIFLVALCYRHWDKLRQSWATRLVRLPPPPPHPSNFHAHENVRIKSSLSRKFHSHAGIFVPRRRNRVRHMHRTVTASSCLPFI